ncbi:class I SAM-dependent methyltransferase [Marinomonas aquimarina]|nr:class I SAM-dependent methyltransferase [Marinomonas aquimarina]
MEVTRKKASQAELASLMTSLLQVANDGEADQICRGLVEYWVMHSLFEKKDGVANQSQYASSGLILSPELAATCAFGWLRTRRYLLALNQVVSELLKDRTNGMPIRVLYPGCGPYGILALPLLTLFSPEQLQVHVIDYHETSIDSVKQLANVFGFSNRIQCTVGDALDYRVQEDTKPDVIVSELLLAGLEKEGHVAINEHLLRQAPNAILIPEQINLSLYFADPQIEFAKKTAREHRCYVGRAFSMNRESLLAADTLTDEISGETLNVPQGLDNAYQSFLFTKIILCQGITVNEYESGLTTPILYPLPKGFQFAKSLQFSYRKGANPRLLCNLNGLLPR